MVTDDTHKQYPPAPPEIHKISEFIGRVSIKHLVIDCGLPCDICLSIVEQIKIMGIKWNNFMSPAWSQWIDEVWGKKEDDV